VGCRSAGARFNLELGTRSVVDVPDSLNSYTAQFPAELESVVAARHMVEAAARSWEIDESVRNDSALTTSELATNAVLHAGSSLSVCVRRLGKGLRIEVSDSNDHLPVVDAERPEELLANRSMTGRGLAMVAATADRWGADPLPGGGKVTWAELGTGRRLVASEPPPAFPPHPKPVTLSNTARAAGVTSAMAVTGGGRKVQLIGVPVQLVVESARHFADLEREIRVMAMDRSGPEELKGVFAAGRQISARVDPWRRVDRDLVAAAAARGDERLDYEIEVPPDAADLVERVTSLVQRLRSSLFRRHFLTGLPRAEVLAYQRWYRDEVLAQLAGRAPAPCPLAVPGPETYEAAF
jgi:anti-sigma regulatory factor (Ser/Thr protein kinase)